MGEVMGVVGESGCGKSTTAFAVMGYLPGTTRVDGRILFEGRGDCSRWTRWNCAICGATA